MFRPPLALSNYTYISKDYVTCPILFKAMKTLPVGFATTFRICPCLRFSIILLLSGHDLSDLIHISHVPWSRHRLLRMTRQTLFRTLRRSTQHFLKLHPCTVCFHKSLSHPRILRACAAVTAQSPCAMTWRRNRSGQGRREGGKGPRRADAEHTKSCELRSAELLQSADCEVICYICFVRYAIIAVICNIHAVARCLCQVSLQTAAPTDMEMHPTPVTLPYLRTDCSHTMVRLVVLDFAWVLRLCVVVVRCVYGCVFVVMCCRCVLWLCLRCLCRCVFVIL